MKAQMTPNELLWAHRYAEAAGICERQLRENPDDLVALSGHATAALCLGRLQEALEEHKRIDALQRPDLKGSAGHEETIGAILWLLGRRDEAIATIWDVVRGIQDGSIVYADLAGGVSPGLMLLYAAVTHRDAAARAGSLEYLSGRAESRRVKYWPGPAALFVLGRTSEEALLMDVCGSADPKKCIRRARTNLLMRRELVQALFCIATRWRGEGAEDRCAEYMRMCASLENPIVEEEWYLAQGETKSSIGPAPSGAR